MDGEVEPRFSPLQPVFGRYRHHFLPLGVIPSQGTAEIGGGATAVPARQPGLTTLQHRHLAPLRLQFGDLCNRTRETGGGWAAAP